MSNAQVGIRLATIFLLALLIGYWATERPLSFVLIDRECEQAQEKYYRALDRVSPNQQEGPQKEKARDDARYHADVCAQNRMAQAAERGLYLLLFTLIFTAIAAASAWNTLGVMKTTAEKQLRAYVNIANAELVLLTSEMATQTYRLQITLKNFGATPAHDVFSSVTVKKGDSFAEAKAVSEITDSHGVIGPTAEVMLATEIEIMRFDAPALEAEIPYIFVDGISIYKDVFAEKKAGYVTGINLVNGPSIFKEPAQRLSIDELRSGHVSGYKMKTRGISKAT